MNHPTWLTISFPYLSMQTSLPSSLSSLPMLPFRSFLINKCPDFSSSSINMSVSQSVIFSPSSQHFHIFFPLPFFSTSSSFFSLTAIKVKFSSSSLVLVFLLHHLLSLSTSFHSPPPSEAAYVAPKEWKPLLWEYWPPGGSYNTSCLHPLTLSVWIWISENDLTVSP